VVGQYDHSNHNCTAGRMSSADAAHTRSKWI